MFGQALVICGMVAMAIGFAAESVAVVSLASYRLRRVLPFQSPLDLHGLGVKILIAGIVAVVVGRVMIVYL
jgi:hypothetical protein